MGPPQARIILAVMCILRRISSATRAHLSGTYSVRHTQQTCDDEFQVLQQPQPPGNEPHLSAILCLSLFPMLDEHTLHYAHLHSNKETTVWTYAFSLCMPPTLERQYRYVTTLLAAFARNMFYGGCSALI